jgi:prepilin-type N-terminal cleavage/methylation domain-containing protein
MKTGCTKGQVPGTDRAMTLIEVIGVMAVLAMLAAILLPAFIKQIDKAVADQESASLASFGDALQRSVSRNRQIPSTGTWAATVAAELGLDVTSVLNTVRRQPRVFLVENNWFGLNSTPYVQTSAGTNLPASPRLMIVSSLGAPLPVFGGNDFTNLWNSAAGRIPTNGAWTSWNGKPADVIVQRINLSSSFVHLMLNYYASTNSAWYAIDNGSTNGPISALDSYFFRNSVVNLYIGPGQYFDTQLILNSDTSLWFYQNNWRGILPGYTGVPGATNSANAFDFSALINGFLNAPAPGNGTGPQQVFVVQSFIDYMDAYTAWAAGNFGNQGVQGSNYSRALQLQSTMTARIGNLISNVVIH